MKKLKMMNNITKTNLSEIKARIDIIESNFNRMQEYFEKTYNSPGLDFVEHIRGEFGYLVKALEQVFFEEFYNEKC